MRPSQQGHYGKVAAKYAKAVFYAEGPLRQWQAGCILEALGSEWETLADVGGGDGRFAAKVAKLAGKKEGSVTLVEPSASMMASGFPGETAIGRRVESDGASWAQRTEERYDRILLKEVVHHFEDRKDTFRALRVKALTETGRVVIATRPKRDIDYPFFRAAKKVWESEQPDEATLAAELRDAGFVRVDVRVLAFPVEVERADWFEMTRNRFWSTFRGFSDHELESGIEELRDVPERVTFEERMVLLTAFQPRRIMTHPVALETQLAVDGFGGPVRVVEPELAAKILADLDNASAGGVEHVTGDARFKLHLVYPALWDLVQNPALVDPVRRYLGADDVLVWSTDLVSKAPNSPGHFTPHQDSAYAGLAPAHKALTAWIALSPAPADAGSLRFFPASHLRGALQHTPNPQNPQNPQNDDHNMLAFGQSIPDYEDQAHLAVPIPLSPGQASFHAMPTVHFSPPNATSTRRVGFAVRYVAADVYRTHGTQRESATLTVGGANLYDPNLGAFDLEPQPRVPRGPDELKARADAVAREAANYAPLLGSYPH